MPENIPIQEPYYLFLRRAFGIPMPTEIELRNIQTCLDFVAENRFESNKFLTETESGELRLRYLCPPAGEKILWGMLPSVSESINPPYLARLPEVNLDRDWVPLEIEGICDVCGLAHEENYFHELSGGIMCEDCIQSIRKNNAVCEDCGAILTGSKTLFDTPNGAYCHNCANDAAEREGWTQCENCDAWTAESTTIVNDSEEWCSACVQNDAQRCDDCGDHYTSLRDAHGRNGRSRTVCESCRENNYFTCEECGDTHHNDNMADDDGTLVCSSCYDGSESSSREDEEHFGSARASYHTTPSVWSRFDRGSAPAFFGLEIETEGDDEVEWTRYDSIPGLKKWIATKDGSLDDTGIEFVSPAIPLSAWEEEAKAFQKMADDNDRQGWKRESCGLHVHMSIDRTDDGADLQKAMLRPFWSDFRRDPTEDEFNTGKAFCQWLGRRYSSSYAHFPKQRYLDDRYMCVGRLSNHVELRIFRSTTNAQAIRGIVGVCNAWQKAAYSTYETQDEWFKAFVDECTMDKHALQYLERCCETTTNQWTEKYRALVPIETKQSVEETCV